MKALKIACDEFITTGRDMSGFDISLYTRADNDKPDTHDVFIVTLMGKLSPGKRGLGTANRVPGSVTYFISKETWQIIKEQG